MIVGHRIRPELCEAIVERVRTGEHLVDVAESVGVSPSTARSICREAGVTSVRRAPQSSAHHGTDKAHVTRWDDGAEARAKRLKQKTDEHHAWLRERGIEPLVGEKFNYHGCKGKQAEVLQSLRDAPIAESKKKRPRVEGLTKQVAKLLDKGMSVAEIALEIDRKPGLVLVLARYARKGRPQRVTAKHEQPASP